MIVPGTQRSKDTPHSTKPRAASASELPQPIEGQQKATKSDYIERLSEEVRSGSAWKTRGAGASAANVTLAEPARPPG